MDAELDKDLNRYKTKLAWFLKVTHVGIFIGIVEFIAILIKVEDFSYCILEASIITLLIGYMAGLNHDCRIIIKVVSKLILKNRV